MVSPSTALPRQSKRSNKPSIRNCSWMIAPSSFTMPLRKKAGRHALRLRRVRKQIAGDLLDDELVVRHVAIDGVDHPIAPKILLARQILFVAVAIGISGHIEPMPGPFLAKVLGRQEMIDLPFVGAGRFVRKKSLRFPLAMAAARSSPKIRAAAAPYALLRLTATIVPDGDVPGRNDQFH